MKIDQSTIREARTNNHVTPQGVAYSWVCGREFILHREARHTDADIRNAKKFLRETRRAEKVRVLRVKIYVVCDSEGVWLTDQPGPTDEVLHETTNQLEAELALCRYVSHGD